MASALSRICSEATTRRTVHHLTVEVRNRSATASLLLLAVLNGPEEAMSPRWRHGTLPACMAGRDACPTRGYSPGTWVTLFLRTEGLWPYHWPENGSRHSVESA